MTENATSTDMNTPATSLTDKERELIRTTKFCIKHKPFFIII